MSAGGWIFAVFLAVPTAGAAKLDITIQVYNAATAPEPEIRKALDEAGWILGRAGIQAHWLDCGDSVAGQGDVRACQQRTEPGLFVLSILPRDPRKGASADVLGFAVLAGRSNGAALIYPRIVTLLKDNPDYADCNILAIVIVHELGHLLSHSPQHGEGIMSGHWGAADFKAMKQRRLTFSQAQARKLQAGVPVRRQAAALSAVGSN